MRKTSTVVQSSYRLKVVAALRVESRRAATTSQSEYPRHILPTASYNDSGRDL